MLQQFLTSSILGVFTLGFFLIWIKNRGFVSAGIFALSYGSAGVAFGFEATYLITERYIFLTPISDTLYMLSALLLSVGLSYRYDRKPPLLWLSLIFIITLMATQWYWFIEDNFNVRTELISYGCAGMIVLGAISIFSRIRSMLDKAIFYSVLSFPATFVFITVLTLRVQNEVLDANSFANSMFLELIQFSVAIFAISIAVLLFTSLAVNVIEELQRLSVNDPLTKVNNRSAFESQALEVVNEYHLNGMQLALIVCDIDNFKAANDLKGHLFGDKALISFVDCLKDCRREIDVIGRIGGDEFAILLPKANIEMARLMAEYARSKFEQQHAHNSAEHLKLTGSFGVAELIEGDTYRSFFERADKMLYAAKYSGRNKVMTQNLKSHSKEKVSEMLTKRYSY